MKLSRGYLRKVMRKLLQRELGRTQWNYNFYSEILNQPERCKKIMQRQEVLHQLLGRYQRVKR